MEGLNYIETHQKTPPTHHITDDFRLKLRILSLFCGEFALLQQRHLDGLGVLMGCQTVVEDSSGNHQA